MNGLFLTRLDKHMNGLFWAYALTTLVQLVTTLLSFFLHSFSLCNQCDNFVHFCKLSSSLCNSRLLSVTRLPSATQVFLFVFCKLIRLSSLFLHYFLFLKLILFYNDLGLFASCGLLLVYNMTWVDFCLLVASFGSIFVRWVKTVQWFFKAEDIHV